MRAGDGCSSGRQPDKNAAWTLKKWRCRRRCCRDYCRSPCSFRVTPAVSAGVSGWREGVADRIFQMYLKNPPSSSGCSCRRQLATGSRQPKRGFGTAVPKTTIEVAERRLSVLCRSIFPANQLKGAQPRSPRREAERAAERCSRARQPINDFSFTQKKLRAFQTESAELCRFSRAEGKITSCCGTDP